MQERLPYRFKPKRTAMPIIKLDALPESALLRRYANGGYTDCYTIEVAAEVTHAASVEAFYTTAVSKPERRRLAMFANRPSSDTLATAL